MRRIAFGFLILWVLAPHLWAEPKLRIIPPTGATFAPGQRFDIRIEGDDLRGQPTQFTLEINGREQKREIIGDQNAEMGYFFRSDHLEFLRKGVPALFALDPGWDYVDKPADYGIAKRAYYVKNDYHKFTDKVKPDWDLSGLVDDAQMMFVTGLEIANGDQRPQWTEQSEFKPRKQAAVCK